jgi:hypothetical protein
MTKFPWLILPVAFIGCAKTPAPVPEAKVDNVVTEYVDSRVTALNKAESTAEKAQQVINQQEDQLKSVP